MTEVNFDSILSSLEAKAARLNEASDTANQVLASIEQRIAKLNIGLEVWHSEAVDEGDAEGDVGLHQTISRTLQFLGFARVGGKWCLALKPVRIVEGFYGGDLNCPYQNQFSAGPPIPLLGSSRKHRISALKVMPKFLAELLQHVSTTAAEIEETADKFQ